MMIISREINSTTSNKQQATGATPNNPALALEGT
jgi:hypothetical protein